MADTTTVTVVEQKLTLSIVENKLVISETSADSLDVTISETTVPLTVNEQSVTLVEMGIQGPEGIPGNEDKYPNYYRCSANVEDGYRYIMSYGDIGWKIMRRDVAPGGVALYATGSSDMATAWENRVTLDYDSL